MKMFMVLVCLALCTFSIGLRLSHLPEDLSKAKVTTSDALGYYIYLPSTFIYHDIKTYDWLSEIDSEYKILGDHTYQLGDAANGNKVVKYFGGVSVMQLPFFAVAHQYAKKNSRYKSDGFSTPYQYAIIVSSIFYFIVGVFLLGFFLVEYFSITVSSLTIVGIIGATNILQYVSVDSGMVHSYLFFWYAFMLFLTNKWMKRPTKIMSLLMGIAAGWATFCRPTEALIVLIPLLWIKGDVLIANNWKKYKAHIIIAFIGAFLIFIPQLIYWKVVTGHFIYDVGSKWTFLNPWFRVLFGWEKGWFIYTPMAVLFITGLWFMKGKPFLKSVVWFTVLNIWIVISWYDWQYGASYSARALSQSLPVLALPFACLLEKVSAKKKYLIGASILIIGLIYVNQFQIIQYNKGILHFNKMNKTYYSRIFLNSSITPLDVSTLDNPVWIDTSIYVLEDRIKISDEQLKRGEDLLIKTLPDSKWLQISFTAENNNCYWDTHYKIIDMNGDVLVDVPAHHAINGPDKKNKYSVFIKNNGNLETSIYLNFTCTYDAQVTFSNIYLAGWK